MTRALCSALLTLLAGPAAAHVVSMSSGELLISGARATYQLRLPIYEVPQVPSPESVLLSHIRFSTSAGEGLLISRACSPDPDRGNYLCTAEYRFPAPVAVLDVECTFPAVISPTHVHMLRAQIGDGPDALRDQAVFDASFSRATLRFRPPTPAEVVVSELFAGAMRAVAGPVQVVFLLVLAIAARSRREACALAAMFVVGQVAAVLSLPYSSFQPVPRFVEAAAALTVAYLSVEVLTLPKAGLRWLVAAILGLFHGLFIYLFLQTTGFRAAPVLAGSAAVQIAAVLLFAWAVAVLARALPRIRLARIVAGVTALFGLGWFVLRLRG